ncbi:MAG: hypothetical protein NT074_05640 [Methanomicrobiales archaeon]|nr:hypothetical protein [Methanomicrobiales archaeon]
MISPLPPPLGRVEFRLNHYHDPDGVVKITVGTGTVFEPNVTCL